MYYKTPIYRGERKVGSIQNLGLCNVYQLPAYVAWLNM